MYIRFFIEYCIVIYKLAFNITNRTKYEQAEGKLGVDGDIGHESEERVQAAITSLGSDEEA